MVYPMFGDDENSVTGYMCLIDYECELGMASGGNKVFSSIEDLKECHGCWESCGIVEVKVSYVKTIIDQNLSLDCEEEIELRDPVKRIREVFGDTLEIASMCDESYEGREIALHMQGLYDSALEAANEIERLLAEIEWAVAAIDADDLIGAHERLEAALRRFAPADQKGQVKPDNCMYRPCRGLVTGYCDCQPGENK